MNRPDAVKLKDTLEIFRDSKYISVLFDLQDDIKRNELDRRYNSVDKTLEYLRSKGLAYRTGDEYRISALGKQVVDGLEDVHDSATMRDKLEPVFDARPDWQLLLPPLDKFNDPTVEDGRLDSSVYAMKYADLVNGASRLREINPDPPLHKDLIDAIEGRGSNIVQNPPEDVEVAYSPDLSDADRIKKLRKEHEDSDYITYHEIQQEYSAAMVITDNKCGLLLHAQLGAEHPVIITDGPEFKQWATSEYESMVENQS